MRYEITLNGKVYEVEVEDNRALLGAIGAAPPVAAAAPVTRLVRRPAGAVTGGVTKVSPAARPAAGVGAAPQSAAHQSATPPAATAAAPVAASASNGEPVNAPMPGLIKEIRVQPGTNVKTGQTLMILEAMKMENEIVSPRDATVTEVIATKGQTVSAGTPLLKIA